MTKQIIKTATIASTSLAVVSQAFAQTTITLQRPPVGVSSLSSLLNAGFRVAIIFAIIFVFAMLILGGYGWLTAGGDKAKVEEARGRITNAIIGLAIIASAWAIVTIVANFFGFDFNTFEIPSAAVEQTSSSSSSSGGGP